MTTTSQKSKSLWLMYLIVGGVILALLVWAMWPTLANVPSRDAVADLGSYGLVTIRFSTDPNPPLPTGTVRLSFMPLDSRQRTLPLDSVRYDYGREGSDQPFGSSEAELMSDGSGMFMGGAQFPEVGNWWVRVLVSKGGTQATVRFTFYVEPAQ
mgnify:CR=1 FL=1